MSGSQIPLQALRLLGVTAGAICSDHPNGSDAPYPGSQLCLQFSQPQCGRDSVVLVHWCTAASPTLGRLVCDYQESFLHRSLSSASQRPWPSRSKILRNDASCWVRSNVWPRSLSLERSRKPIAPADERAAIVRAMDPPWSHLNLSYRGENGKTAGYYVPKAGRGIHARRSRCWAANEQCLRELAELNKGRAICNGPARLIRNESMFPSNPCLLCTALSVPQPPSLSRPEARLTDCRLATMVRSRARTYLDVSPVSVVTRMRFALARLAPVAFLAP